MSFLKKTALILSFPLALLGWGCQRPSKDIAWMVYYGDTLKESDLSNVSLMIVEPDHIRPRDFPKFDGLWVAYLSLGEINESRSYFQALKAAGALIEGNPQWPGAHRVDPRSQAWRQRVIDEIVPDLMGKGYHGLFLDTLDVASYLESKDPQKYAGSVDAMVGLIEAIHDKYPQMIILPNNGLDFLHKLAPSVDAVVVEDLYETYDESQKKFMPASKEWVKLKESVLDSFRKRYSKNVFVIHYGNTLGDELSKESASKAKAKGYQSYLTTIDLNQFGIVTKK